MLEAKVVIDTASPKIEISNGIYGNFIEHIGKCIYNGIWTYDPVNVPLVQDNPLLTGIRQDLLHAVRQLQIPILRFPGGCYSDVYHWKNAIGLKLSRKKVKNKAWNRHFLKFFRGLGPTIENQFGTDEFIAFCQAIEAAPYLNVNYGIGTPEEAAEWVEYCNGGKDTEFGALRTSYGHAEPYNVKLWGIANEIYGFWEIGYERRPENYAKKYLEFAKKMKAKDPDIHLVACGNLKSKWNRTLLSLIAGYVDYLSVHYYVPFPYTPLTILRAFIGKKHTRKKKHYYSLLAAPLAMIEIVEKTWQDIISVFGEDTKVRIIIDEWGVWYKFTDLIQTNYNLLDGLYAALTLMTFQHLSDKAPICLWSQLVNTLGLIQTDKDGLILTPVYLAFALLRQQSYQYLVTGTDIDCETFDCKQYGTAPKAKDVPYIECNVTIDSKDDNLSIILVNKHFSEGISTSIEIRNFQPSGKTIIFELNSQSPFDYNTTNEREKIRINQKQININSPQITIDLPKHSLTVIKLRKRT
ncbi:MAG: alpha-L-arabinofuranosidase C-terminal domain-containing protein [Candidatus Helarchaeota archaeon]